MRAPRNISIAVSLLLFGITGIIMHIVASPDLCAHRGRAGLATILGIVLLIASFFLHKEDKSDRVSVRRVCSFVLVVLISMGIWYEVWSTQACNTGTRDDLVHQ